MPSTRSTVLPTLTRSAFVVTVATAMVLGSGCTWFKSRGNGYAQNPRPLEVPPDLVAGGGNVVASGGSVTQSALQGFQIAGTRDAAFAKIATAMQGMPGVTISNQSVALGLFEITVNGSPVLLRIAEQNGQSNVTAVNPRGEAGSADAIQAFLTSLQARLQ